MVIYFDPYRCNGSTEGLRFWTSGKNFPVKQMTSRNFEGMGNNGIGWGKHCLSPTLQMYRTKAHGAGCGYGLLLTPAWYNVQYFADKGYGKGSVAMHIEEDMVT